jgi:2-methylcitrate dehydratase PrpD
VRFDGSDECTILGQSKKASAVHAALINATSGHSLDLDDGHRQALGIAAIQSAGLLAVVHSGQIMQPLNAGKAAYNGVLSALLARGGASGK